MRNLEDIKKTMGMKIDEETKAELKMLGVKI